MDSNNMLKLCRLCLVKDDVNIPIFEEQGDIRQIFLKISSCLPVKVSRDDQLPKKICDGCSYKLDMLHEFWNTSANAEKQLLTWLGEAGMSSQMADGTISAVAQQIKPADAFVKQETIDPPDIHMDDDDDDDEEDKDYMKQEEENSNNVEEPPPKRARRTAAVKAAIALDQNSDDDDDSGEPMTKVEDDSEDSDNEDHEPAFVDVPSTSADDQPGPSGVGKDGVEAPKNNNSEEILILIDEDNEVKHEYIDIKEEFISGVDTSSKYVYIDGQKIEFENIVEVVESGEEFSKGTETQSSSKKLCLCSICGKLVKNIVKHSLTHGKEYCDLCRKSFKTSEELQTHKEDHISDNYQCTECDLMFKDTLDFVYHNYMHLKTYSCTLCTFKTTRKASIKGHILRHQGKFNYHCDICGKGFLVQCMLDSHVEMHLDIKKYSCQFCDKKFAVKRYLHGHMSLNHRKELFGINEPFKCDECGREFTFMKSLTRHKSIMHQIGEDRTVECPVCNKVIANNYNLKLHMRVHTGEKKYCCDLCGKAFSAFKYWKKHWKAHEKKETVASKDESVLGFFLDDAENVNLEDIGEHFIIDFGL